MKKAALIGLLLITFNSFGQIAHKRKLSMLGSPFEVTVVANDTVKANEYIDLAVAEVKRIENLISDWIPTTQISEVNRNAGIKPVKVDAEVFDLVGRSIKISEITSGAFDISYASMDKIWKFDGSMKAMPTEEAIKKLAAKGCTSGIINVSGDINAWGKQPDGKPWTVGIVNPLNKNKIFATFPLENSSVETSGNYEKFVVFNGIRYSHIIDTRTGYPATGVASVSVFAKQTEIADALATGIFVLGVDVGLDLVNQLKGIECIIVDDKGKIHSSKGIDVKKYEQ